MVTLKDLPTPIVAIDLDQVEANIKNAARKSQKYEKCLWPMIKTHKTSHIAKLQKEAGAEGFVCGTITEAEMLAKFGITDTILLGYPLADPENFTRVASLIHEGSRVLFRVDCASNAKFLNKMLGEQKIRAEAVVKIDTGYHRHGVSTENAGQIAKQLVNLENIEFAGIVTHPGHAYDATSPEEVKNVAEETATQMKVALHEIRKHKEPRIVGTGATPTFQFDVHEEVYTHLFPGNYVYYDRQQACVFGATQLEKCALTILATIISRPAHADGGLAIINAGSRYFDKRTSETLKGFGRLVEHSNAFVIDLSQEVGKVDISTASKMRVGEKLKVLPNHACFANNAVSHLIGHRKGKVKAIIPVNGNGSGKGEGRAIRGLM